MCLNSVSTVVHDVVMSYVAWHQNNNGFEVLIQRSFRIWRLFKQSTLSYLLPHSVVFASVSPFVQVIFCNYC